MFEDEPLPEPSIESKFRIDNALQKARDEAKIKLKKAVRRNAIFVGKSRVGKTTAMNTLKDPTFFVKDMSIFADTMKPSLYSFNVEVKGRGKRMKQALAAAYNQDRKLEKEQQERNEKRQKALEKKEIEFPEDVIPNSEDNDEPKTVVKPQPSAKQDDQVIKELDELNFCVNIIDTPGLFERRRVTDEKRDNDTLIETIMQCLNNEIPVIHAIFLVASIKSGVAINDVKAFKEFIELFSGAEDNIAMIFTRSENISLTEMKKKLEELKQQKDYHELIQILGEPEKKVFFTGAAGYNTFQQSLLDGTMVTVDSVCTSRNALLQFLFFKTKPCSVRNFKIVKYAGEEAVKSLNTIIRLIGEYKRATDKQSLIRQIDELYKQVAKSFHVVPDDQLELLSKAQDEIEYYMKDKMAHFL